MNEKRRTYVQLKGLLKNAAGAITIFERGEAFTCRVAVNAGLELVIGGVELLKAHGISKEASMNFIGHLFDQPGDIEEMHKGGRHEGLLRMAMKLINGPVIRHSAMGDVLEDSVEHTHDGDIKPFVQLDPSMLN